MQKLIAPRFALSAIIILTIIAVAIIAFAVVSHHTTGTVWTVPN